MPCCRSINHFFDHKNYSRLNLISLYLLFDVYLLAKNHRKTLALFRNVGCKLSLPCSILTTLSSVSSVGRGVVKVVWK
ncbi:unnamed protein product [Callosobruchus maculatus]|uniref:Uncharacterized protein n=1 Tax=Callosobruchus maculatus TaxID=64391 RepID=A0A653BK22_CALMS|nr:unnamed protein product [Callosobruchus maculatus]